MNKENNNQSITKINLYYLPRGRPSILHHYKNNNNNKKKWKRIKKKCT